MYPAYFQQSFGHCIFKCSLIYYWICLSIVQVLGSKMPGYATYSYYSNLLTFLRTYQHRRLPDRPFPKSSCSWNPYNLQVGNAPKELRVEVLQTRNVPGEVWYFRIIILPTTCLFRYWAFLYNLLNNHLLLTLCYISGFNSKLLKKQIFMTATQLVSS